MWVLVLRYTALAVWGLNTAQPAAEIVLVEEPVVVGVGEAAAGYIPGLGAAHKSGNRCNSAVESWWLQS